MSNSLSSLFKKERPWATCSCHSLKKSNREWIALASLYKRATVSKSLTYFFKKEQCQWFTRDSSKLLSKNEPFDRKKPNFLYVFDSFPPFYAKIANGSHCSLLINSFLNSYGSNLLSSFFTKERLWANRSSCSLQMSNRERIAQVAHDKRATGAIHSFSQTNHSFPHKKREICSKNQWENSQPSQ